MPLEKEIQRLEKEISLIPVNELYSQEYTRLTDELEAIDPYNDLFHLGCPGWPNCEDIGCRDHLL